MVSKFRSLKPLLTPLTPNPKPLVSNATLHRYAEAGLEIQRYMTFPTDLEGAGVSSVASEPFYERVIVAGLPYELFNGMWSRVGGPAFYYSPPPPSPRPPPPMPPPPFNTPHEFGYSAAHYFRLKMSAGGTYYEVGGTS